MLPFYLIFRFDHFPHIHILHFLVISLMQATSRTMRSTESRTIPQVSHHPVCLAFLYTALHCLILPRLALYCITLSRLILPHLTSPFFTHLKASYHTTLKIHSSILTTPHYTTLYCAHRHS